MDGQPSHCNNIHFAVYLNTSALKINFAVRLYQNTATQYHRPEDQPAAGWHVQPPTLLDGILKILRAVPVQQIVAMPTRFVTDVQSSGSSSCVGPGVYNSPYHAAVVYSKFLLLRFPLQHVQALRIVT